MVVKCDESGEDTALAIALSVGSRSTMSSSLKDSRSSSVGEESSLVRPASASDFDVSLKGRIANLVDTRSEARGLDKAERDRM